MRDPGNEVVIEGRRCCCSIGLPFHKARLSPDVARVVYKPLQAKISHVSTLSEIIYRVRRFDGFSRTLARTFQR